MKKRKGFTLAEVLVTLMIIGVVAAITIPTLMNNINNSALANQRKTVGAKLAEGFGQMKIDGALNETYADTMAFVNAMKKYFKINAVCKSTELTNCFNATVSDSENANEISKMDGVENVVGLILSDGTSMLIKYDKDAEKISEGSMLTFSGGDAKYATFRTAKDENSEHPYLIQYLFDVNSNKSPNTLGKDIVGDLPVAAGVNLSCDDESYSPGFYYCSGDGLDCYECIDSKGTSCRCDKYTANGRYYACNIYGKNCDYSEIDFSWNGDTYHCIRCDGDGNDCEMCYGYDGGYCESCDSNGCTDCE